MSVNGDRVIRGDRKNLSSAEKPRMESGGVRAPGSRGLTPKAAKSGLNPNFHTISNPNIRLETEGGVAHAENNKVSQSQIARPKSNKTVKESPTKKSKVQPRPRAVSERGGNLSSARQGTTGNKNKEHDTEKLSNPLGGGVSQFVDDLEDSAAANAAAEAVANNENDNDGVG